MWLCIIRLRSQPDCIFIMLAFFKRNEYHEVHKNCQDDLQFDYHPSISGSKSRHLSIDEHMTPYNHILLLRLHTKQAESYNTHQFNLILNTNSAPILRDEFARVP